MSSAFEIENVDWNEAIADFDASNRGRLAPKTVIFYRQRLKMVVRWAEANEVSLQTFRARDQRQYMAFRTETGLSEQTRRSDAVALKTFLKFCFAEKYITSDPLVSTPAPKAAKPHVKKPSAEEMKRIFEAVKAKHKPAFNPNSRFSNERTRRFLSKRDYAIIAGLLDTGARISEMLSLRLGDIDWTEKQIVFAKTKGKQPRTVPVSDEWLRIVGIWQNIRPSHIDCDFLFITLQGGPVDAKSFSRSFVRYCQFAEVGSFTLHSLRHYAITTMAENNLWAASQIAGHKDLRVTRGYLHGNSEHVRAAHAAAGPLSNLLGSEHSTSNRRKRVI